MPRKVHPSSPSFFSVVSQNFVYNSFAFVISWGGVGRGHPKHLIKNPKQEGFSFKEANSSCPQWLWSATILYSNEATLTPEAILVSASMTFLSSCCKLMATNSAFKSGTYKVKTAWSAESTNYSAKEPLVRLSSRTSPNRNRSRTRLIGNQRSMRMFRSRFKKLKRALPLPMGVTLMI